MLVVLASRPTPGSGDFIPQVESVRGLAALMVLIGHCWVFSTAGALPFGGSVPPVFARVAAGILDPQPAVFLFFTVSGFAIGVNIRATGMSTLRLYVAFVLRRITRLVPAMWSSTGFAALSLMAVGLKVSLGTVLGALVLQDLSINVALWTLSAEIVCSTVFPMIYIMAGRLGVVGNMLLSAMLIAFMFLDRSTTGFKFIAFFHAGLMVSAVNARCGGWLFGWTGKIIFLSGVVGVIWAPQFLTDMPRNWTDWNRWAWLELPACFIVLLFVVYRCEGLLASVLLCRPVRWCGRISYSLYLIHLPVYAAVSSLLKAYVASDAVALPIEFLGTTTCVLGISVPLAILNYEIIERPTIKLGRRLSAWIRVAGHSAPRGYRLPLASPLAAEPAGEPDPRPEA